MQPSFTRGGSLGDPVGWVSVMLRQTLRPHVQNSLLHRRKVETAQGLGGWAPLSPEKEGALTPARCARR